jgi:hypothetical protein
MFWNSIFMGAPAPRPWTLAAGACRALASGAASKQGTAMSHATLNAAVTNLQALFSEQNGAVIR